jgi:L-threonylcarbamoyladenylate synthase
LHFDFNKPLQRIVPKGFSKFMIGKDILQAKEHLIKGDLVAIPTETVYGLAGNALGPETVAQIFEAKNRPTFDPLIVHTYSIEQATHYVKEFPNWAQTLASACWPGPLTLLLPKNETIPDLVTSGSDLVGIRVPNHPLTLSLLRSLSFPLAAPSANPFGYVSPTTAHHVEDQMGSTIPYILDGGNCEVGVESTIVGLKEGKPAVFRTGGVPLETIEKLLGTGLAVLPSSSKPSAPGMLESHYSPKIPLLLGDIPTLMAQQVGKKIGIISFYRDYASFANKTFILSPSQNLKEAASRLFASLREMDKQEIDVILSEPFPEEGLGRAINDRLRRAAVKR